MEQAKGSKVEFIIERVDGTKATYKGKRDAKSTLDMYSGGFLSWVKISFVLFVKKVRIIVKCGCGYVRVLQLL